MKNIAIVYWSGTGNTEKMANSIYEAAKDNFLVADIFRVNEFDCSLMEEYENIIFGCPSMGAEELEEDEFAPLFEKCELLLSGKTIALFGSYGWGDGEWMRIWKERCELAGANVVDCVICCEEPDEEAISNCKDLVKKLI